MRLTNYFEHPESNKYMVYVFHEEIHANFFQDLLEERNVIYERFLDEESGSKEILFGIDKRFIKQANRSNFLTHGEYRRPMIKNRKLAYILIAFTLSFVALAVVGYIKSSS